jgi:hypothetical protein
LNEDEFHQMSAELGNHKRLQEYLALLKTQENTSEVRDAVTPIGIETTLGSGCDILKTSNSIVIDSQCVKVNK